MKRTHEEKLSKILVPIDGSKFSMDAAKFGIILSIQHDAELIILHVLHPTELDLSLHSFGTEQPQHTNKLIENKKKEVNEWFDSVRKISKEYGKDKEVDIKTDIIVSSSIAPNIVDYAEKQSIDLIVIGTRGRTGLDYY
jgi:nucleotide-binding universal stress UspA family protein